MTFGGAYSVLMIAGIVLGAWLWSRITGQQRRRDPRLTIIYIAALLGAIIGAKLAFLLAEGWHYRDNWLALLTGRSITGGLLGGYAAVEFVKWRTGYRQATGDAFALIVPIGLMLGRLGCWIEGCCQGALCAEHWWSLNDSADLSRWPVVPLEIAFNATFFTWALAARRFRWLRGNQFHVYLIAYGLFRFVEEIARDTARIGETPFSAYQVIALAIAVFGIERFVRRAKETREASAKRPMVSSVR
ncbi:MAG: prolipoprotein diacylglyceryl transferase [Phycisphaerales bacterium]|nr:prolipoprotein diacylglyceryl transferase [Phycisphaerales bacterium]